MLRILALDFTQADLELRLCDLHVLAILQVPLCLTSSKHHKMTSI